MFDTFDELLAEIEARESQRTNINNLIGALRIKAEMLDKQDSSLDDIIKRRLDRVNKAEAATKE
jgi:hypothetical protein